MARACLALLCFGITGAGLQAQTIDESRSRFLSAPHGRTGTYAPYRLVINDLGGADTLVVRSVCDGVILRQEVAVGGQEFVQVILPVMISQSARVSMDGAQTVEFEPELPLRRVEPDFARPYAAVFSTDPVYARGLLPSTQGGAVCDYYEIGEFFTDWRLFDGYDAIVILNPAEVRLPEGSQRAIAEFCSLGGCAMVVGSFRLGEKAVDLPAPADAAVQMHRGVAVQRFGYGAGAIYRISADDLRASAAAQDVIVDALRDHLWYGASTAPAGKPVSRVAPLRPPLATPLPPVSANPGPLFWALAGGLLVLCGLAPAVTTRFTRHILPAQAVTIAVAMALAAAGTLQERPLPPVETCTVVSTGQGKAASSRSFLHAHGQWQSQITVDLDGDSDRPLYRACPSAPGWRAWVEDRPLVAPSADQADFVVARGGMVANLSFRDFGSAAHRGNTEFSRDDAWLLDWWLEETAYRGRAAQLAPTETRTGPWPGARLIPRGAIRVTALRAGD